MERLRRTWRPLSPACEACREPSGTCFPGPCKIYQARRAQSTKAAALVRTRAQWSNMRPEAVVAGSDAQVLNCIRDARSEILNLWARIDQLECEKNQLTIADELTKRHRPHEEGDTP
jgi:hypothetical protein